MATRAHQGLLQPTAKQQQRLEALLASQRELYNAALEERRGAWQWNQRRVAKFEQFRQLTGWDHPIMEFGVVPARGTLTRLDRAFRAFFRRVRAGERPGYPRFRGKQRFHSVEYPDASCWRVEGNRLYLKGVGHIKFRTSNRGIRGTPKSLTVKREGRRWRFTVFCSDVPEQRLPASDQQVGIDLGVTELVATSGGELVANPRWLKECQERLASAQRLVAGRQRGSGRRRRAAERVGALHRKVARQRRDHHHQLSRRLVNHYHLIVHEQLQVPNLTRRPKPKKDRDGGYLPNGARAKAGLNREISGAGWGELLAMVAYKAEEAGRCVVAVDPRFSSQACHQCGHVSERNRHGAVFRCVGCGYADHADVNAARNILRAGLAQHLECEATESA